MREPGIIHINSLAEAWNTTVLIGGRWHPARPLSYSSPWQRWKAAWLVFTGRADALKWHKQ